MPIDSSGGVNYRIKLAAQVLRPFMWLDMRSLKRSAFILHWVIAGARSGAMLRRSWRSWETQRAPALWPMRSRALAPCTAS